MSARDTEDSSIMPSHDLESGERTPSVAGGRGRRRIFGALAVLALAAGVGCAGSSEDGGPRSSGASTTTLGAAPALPSALVADPTLVEALRAEGLGGTIALYVEGADEVRCADVADCTVRSTPASTFKIANSMLALESGVAPDLDFALPWDGTPSVVPECEHEVSMRVAFRASCVPYYQEIARRIGLEAMRAGVIRLGYGNAEIGSVVDRFWLDGPLAISPVEQVDFLRRFATGALPIGERTHGLVRELMVRDQRGDAVLRGKTGWAHAGTPEERGWFVGFVERGDRRAYVAVRATRDRSVPDARFIPARMAAAIRALESAGMY